MRWAKGVKKERKQVAADDTKEETWHHSLECNADPNSQHMLPNLGQPDTTYPPDAKSRLFEEDTSSVAASE